MSQAKEWYRLWCIHLSFCKTLTVVERQPFRPYSQRRGSRWNDERFIKSCVSFAHWKRFTRGLPVDGRLLASFWQFWQYQANPQKTGGKCRTCLSLAPKRQRWQLFACGFMQCMTSWFASEDYLDLKVPKTTLTWWIISEVIQPPRMELISVNLLISGHGTLICEEWLWMVNGVTRLLCGA